MSRRLPPVAGTVETVSVRVPVVSTCSTSGGTALRVTADPAGSTNATTGA